jgi:23S rRNA pseudoU1915 N3-methylase RlmH
VEINKLKPSKRKEEKEIIQEETLILKEKLQKEKGYKILLYITGKVLSTEALYEMIEAKKQHFSDIVFII